MDKHTPHLLPPEFHKCIIGLSERPGEDQVVTYDFEKVISKLRKDFNTDRAGAVQRWDDMLRGVAPERMPCFLSHVNIRQIDEIYKLSTITA